LLSAMEGAGKLVEDEELREAMREKGLGTPATRSAIIEGLIHDGYVHRQGRELIATAKGLALITLLRGIGATELCSPEMTGEWEYKLKRMAKGHMQANEFMKGIKEFTREVVEKAKNFEGESVTGDFEPLDVLDRAYACENAVAKEKTCTFRISKNILHREIPKEQVQKLITTGKTDLLPKFVSKKGRPFSAHLKLENGKVGFEFAERKPKKRA